MTRIALIHAVAVAMAPVSDAFAALWPDADAISIFDESLSPDRARDTDLTDTMTKRIGDLGRYALTTGADGILYTCSAFGPAIAGFAATTPKPVLRPNEAMFDEALGCGTRLGMLATFGPSVASMEAEFQEAAAERGVAATVETVLIEEAMRALKGGDAETHNRLLAEAAPRLAHCDAVMLAHFSTSRAYEAVSATIDAPVLTAPRAAVAALRQRVG
ncbi:aspartate/glutamate racemase family protein [Acuticoccus kandeliae]|uniref:aspartate/glutamate racemase family protein n=1 Tax=Acuticoccus kandeliae TaxID=2073160 RepID=UPI000D3E0E30|nr:aspartate/glutamate racemase family protein [Acuticoccus kandeliae]